MTSLIERIDTLAQTYAARTGRHATVLYVGWKELAEMTGVPNEYLGYDRVRKSLVVGALLVIEVNEAAWLQVGEVF